MSRPARPWCLVLVVFLLTACGAGRSALKPSEDNFTGAVLARSVSTVDGLGVPNEPGDTFSTADEKVVAHVRLKNLAAACRLHWEWYSPEGRLYTRSEDLIIDEIPGEFRPMVSAWHTLGVRGDKASQLPGKWSVKVFANNDLVDTQTFMLRATVDLSLPENVSQTADPDKWALVIGIESYARLPEVEYARKDALVVKEYFRRVLGVPEENILMLVDNDATKARIEGYLHYYLPQNTNQNTQLYVYFAGHGAPHVKDGIPFLVPYDGDTRFLHSTGYPLKKFYADLDKIGNRRTYVFMDACFSGFASRTAEMLTKGSRPALLHVKAEQIENDKIVAISSSSSNQPSNAYAATEHGLFTFFLLKGLSGEADADKDRQLQVSEIYQYVFDNVTRTARRLGAQQTPAITPSITKVKHLTIGQVP